MSAAAALYFTDAASDVVAAYPVPDSWRSSFAIPGGAVRATLRFVDGETFSESDRPFSAIDHTMVIGPVVQAEMIRRAKE